jgi:hypothetical protein
MPSCASSARPPTSGGIARRGSAPIRLGARSPDPACGSRLGSPCLQRTCHPQSGGMPLFRHPLVIPHEGSFIPFVYHRPHDAESDVAARVAGMRIILMEAFRRASASRAAAFAISMKAIPTAYRMQLIIGFVSHRIVFWGRIWLILIPTPFVQIPAHIVNAQRVRP